VTIFPGAGFRSPFIFFISTDKELNMSIKKDWANVYVLRQEYNKYQRRWFPIVVYWNTSGGKMWQEALCTEDGSSYYHNEVKDYTRVTRLGTDKCDAEEVKRIVKEYEHENSDPVYEVQKLAAYRPGIA
jgi:hypothetical protein